MSMRAVRMEPIAIRGLWCRVPGAESPSEFWRNLCANVVSIAPIPRERLIASGVAASIADDPCYVPWRGILQHATAFDAQRFGVSPAEAELTDPQHRQFLECAYLALGDAGLPANPRERVGVFAACSSNAYHDACNVFENTVQSLTADIVNGSAHLATSVAYRLGARGPAVAVQSACSGSLVAVHLACQALLAGDCDLALAGGASIGWPQERGHMHVPGGIMSADGRCAPFDLSASGTVRGEGVGVVVLQRLCDAQRSGRRVHAVIRGTAVNNDGSTRMGFAAPSSMGQSDLIRQALGRAGVAAADLTFVETHGTGTIVGDAIELSALHEVFAATRADSAPLWLGAAKANLGHLDAAAGVIGLIKSVLSLTHRALPPLANFSAFHPDCAAYSTGVAVSRVMLPLSVDDALLAGISSFGLGGTNAHVIIESHRAEPHASPSRIGASVMPLVAASAPALAARFDAIRAHARAQAFDPLSLADEQALQHDAAGVRGAALIATDRIGVSWDELRIGIDSDPARTANPLRLVFSGARVAAERLDDVHTQCEPWRRQFDPLAAKVLQETGIDPRAADDERSGSDAELGAKLTRLCVDVAMARLLAGLGLNTTAPAATDVDGEIAAACVSGYLAIEEAAELLVILHREGMNARELQDWIDNLPARDGAAWFARARPQSRLVAAALLDIRSDDATMQGRSTHGSPSDDAAFELRPGSPFDADTAELHSDAVSLPSGGLPLTKGYQRLLQVLADLWLQGGSIAWNLLRNRSSTKDVWLPPLPLERRVFDPRKETHLAVDEPAKPTLSTEIRGALSADVPVSFDREVRTAFEAVLGVSNVGNEDNFFDLGGCSLTALDVLDRVSTATGRRASLRAFLDTPTVRGFAAVLEASNPSYGSERSTRSEVTAPKQVASPHSPLFAPIEPHRQQHGPDFSVFFFSGEAPQAASRDLYRLVIDAAKFADTAGFAAIWLPERHFHRFGGLFPSPAVLGAAIATVTERVGIRAGSVVLPLHHPVEVAEQWAVVDNLSNGRVGLSLAPGFHPTDFMLCPDRFADRRDRYWSAIATLQALWAGEPFVGPDGLNREVEVLTLPRPQQPKLPLWITASESEQSFREAGLRGANVLTALLALDVDTLAQRIRVYREALKESGATHAGVVTVMLHAFVDTDPVRVHAIGVQALRQYLDGHLDFASARTRYAKVASLPDVDREALVDHAVKRYLDDASLIGTPAHCATVVCKLVSIGVDEIACLVDFGVPVDDVIKSLQQVAALQTSLRSRMVIV